MNRLHVERCRDITGLGLGLGLVEEIACRPDSRTARFLLVLK